MSLGMLGLFMEIKSPGFGVPGTVGLICLALFFGSHFLVGLADMTEVIFLLAGIALILMEILVIPGFGVVGISGICIVFYSFFLLQKYAGEDCKIAEMHYKLADAYEERGKYIRAIEQYKLAEKYNWLYKFSLNKWYIDELYSATFIGGTLAFSRILAWFDTYIIDGIVNGAAWVTRKVSSFSGLFDTYVVDGLVNFTAFFSGVIGLGLKKIQTGKVQTYVVLAVFSILVLLLILRPF
jgi:NADH:ubiquinone oxidoreductase subunit 5 (subunit L)/multisubunit Na+/H+ antiporter MnhA subunit